MRTIYLIAAEDIADVAEAMCIDYEVNRGVLQLALERFVVDRMEQFMEELREQADLDKLFNLKYVERAERDWKRVNPEGLRE